MADYILERAVYGFLIVGTVALAAALVYRIVEWLIGLF